MALSATCAMRRASPLSTHLTIESALANLRISQSTPSLATLVSRRHASHQAQGRANGAKDGPGKRLGAKKTAGEYVVTGNILYKQRGTLWFPGDNCFMGRDHTIHAGAPGYVTYYRDPAKHPKRKFIGVVFEKHHTLPQPPNAVRRRRLGMLAFQMPRSAEIPETGDLSVSVPPTSIGDEPQGSRGTKIGKASTGLVGEPKLTLRPGYMYRQANWEIGRAAERSKQAQMVLPFRPHDRFAAWRKASLRKARNAERRAMGRGGKKKK